MPSGDGSLHVPVTRKPGLGGFTIIELLVVMAVLAVLASLVVPRYMDRVDTARETVLRQDLQGLRTAIDQFYRDQSRYPEALEELVSKRYIRAIPVDPITQKANTWVPVQAKDGGSGVFDVKSGSPLRSGDGSAHASW